MTSQLGLQTNKLGLQTNGIHILPNTSRSKGNHGIKFDQLMEYDMRNTFVEKSYTKCAGEITPRP